MQAKALTIKAGLGGIVDFCCSKESLRNSIEYVQASNKHVKSQGATQISICNRQSACFLLYLKLLAFSFSTHQSISRLTWK